MSVLDSSSKPFFTDSIPNGWEIKKLGDIFDLKQGKSISSKRKDEGTVEPFLRTSNVLWGQLDLAKLDEMVFSEKEKKLLTLEKNDLLVCEGGEIGRTAIWNKELENCYFQNHVHRLRAKDASRTHPKFFMYWMYAAFKIFGLYQGMGVKTSIPNLSGRRLLDFDVPVPLYHDQQRISYVLSKVSENWKETERVIYALQELKKSMMRHLFTYGPVPIDEVDNVELKETEIGMIPAHWDIGFVKDLCSPRKESINPEQAGDVIYVGLEHIVSGRFNLTNWGNPDSVRSSKFVFYPGDVLYGKLRPYLDKAVSTDLGGVCSTDIIVLVPNEANADSNYLVSFLHSKRFLEMARMTTTGVNHPRTSWSKIKDYLIPMPNVNDRREIVSILSSIEASIQSELNKQNSIEISFNSMLDSLMTGRLRVNELEV